MLLLYYLNKVHKQHLIYSILNLLQFSCSPTKEFSVLFQDLLFYIKNEDNEKQLILNYQKTSNRRAGKFKNNKRGKSNFCSFENYNKILDYNK